MPCEVNVFSRIEIREKFAEVLIATSSSTICNAEIAK